MKIKVCNQGKERIIEGLPEENLLDVLRRNHVFVPAVCNGNGTCGKCKVRIMDDISFPISEADRKCLAESEMEEGVRLACKAKVRNDLRVTIALEEDSISVQSVDASEDRIMKKIELLLQQEERDCFIAIDLGSTTIAMALVEVKTGKIMDTYTCLNHQRMYGADVISRIAASNQGKAGELKKTIEQDLWQGICYLTKKIDKITKCILVGNTTMIHLALGYSCESLGKYPFYSDHLGLIDTSLGQVIKESQESKWGKIPFTILPGISPFVGGDIVADLLFCQEFQKESISLLIDLGTNGEMILGEKERLFATSTAAGPAFEGGNISCGTGSIPGAISQIKIQNRRPVIKTIGNILPPKGICGTGIVSIISQLLQNRLVDSQGTLQYPYSEKGYLLGMGENGQPIVLTQKDIRQFQMAKSSIRAGIDVLMEHLGCTPNEVDHVYIAGGFGFHLSKEDAIVTGILPQEFQGKIQSIGNGALQGAILYGMNQNKEAINSYMDKLIQKIQPISLAQEENFQGKYFEYLNFLS